MLAPKDREVPQNDMQLTHFGRSRAAGSKTNFPKAWGAIHFIGAFYERATLEPLYCSDWQACSPVVESR